MDREPDDGPGLAGARPGARSVALGVDGGNPAPVALYRAAGFATVDTVEMWECDVSATPDAPWG